VLAGAITLALVGCGSSGVTNSSGGANSAGAGTTSVPAYVTEPFTHEQQLVAQGARLVVSDGCAACHLSGGAHVVGPSFSSFAGHRVTLRSGQSVLVDERFVREGLLHPRAYELRGYEPQPMLKALARLHLNSSPQQIADLAAFIDQVGPEPE